jgi:hypothetical protein
MQRKKREKGMNNNEEIWDISNHTNTHIMRVPEGKQRKE